MKKEREAKGNSELDGDDAFGEIDVKGASAAAKALKARNRARQKFIQGVQIDYGKGRLKVPTKADQNYRKGPTAIQTNPHF